MTEFTARKLSEAVVVHERQQVWDALVDPDLVASITPMVSGIRADGDLWLWSLARIPLLGRHYDLHFTEQMAFTEPEQIVFRHEPQGAELAGVQGRYDLTEVPGGTRLSIDLAITVDLSLPRLSRPVVQTAMHAVLEVMGVGFARGLERHLTRG